MFRNNIWHNIFAAHLACNQGSIRLKALTVDDNHALLRTSQHSQHHPSFSPRHSTRLGEPQHPLSGSWGSGSPDYQFKPMLRSHRNAASQTSSTRHFSTTHRRKQNTLKPVNSPSQPDKLTHVSDAGSAHMVSIADKQPTKRVAKARCRVVFTSKTAAKLIRDNQIQKGDVLGVARVAGIMAAKRTPDLIPLCHPISITKVTLDLMVNEADDDGGDCGSVDVEATVGCEGKTGVEMEALMAASTAALTVYDMCKAVDKGMRIEGLRVVRKEGGKSGTWVEGVQEGS